MHWNSENCIYYIPGGDCAVSNRVKIMCMGCNLYTPADTSAKKGIKGIITVFGIAKKLFKK